MSRISLLRWFAAWVALPGCISASTVFSDLLPGNQYVCCNGYNVAPAGPIAAAFTTTQSFALNEIDVAVWNDELPQQITIVLAADSGGVPGAAIESWNVPDIVPPPAGSVTFGASTAVSVQDTLNVFLTPNTQYWVEVESATGSFWNVNSLNSGPDDTFAGFNAGTWHVLVDSPQPPAFDVLGTATAVPEPSFGVLLGLACSALFGNAFRDKPPRSTGRMRTEPCFRPWSRQDG